MGSRCIIRALSVVILLLIVSCGQWKVSALKSKKLCTLKKGSEPGAVMIDYNESGALNLSFGVWVYGGKIYVADNILNRLQVLGLDGSPSLIIGKKIIQDSKDLPAQSQFNFSVIGSLATDSAGNIFVQNRLMPSGNRSAGRGKGEMDFSPSYVLVFDNKGNLQHTIGQRGTPDIPFYYIDSMEVDKKDRLFVISRTFDNWTVYRFSGKKRDFYITLGEADLKETEGNEEYSGKIENVKVFSSGESFLVSVAYYSKARFKYRKILEYKIAGGRAPVTVLTLPDPKNEMFTLVDDKHIYLWNVDGKKVKFVIMNFEGNVINNVLLELQEGRYLEEITTDETGQMFSYHVGKDDLEIQEWK